MERRREQRGGREGERGESKSETETHTHRQRQRDTHTQRHTHRDPTSKNSLRHCTHLFILWQSWRVFKVSTRATVEVEGGNGFPFPLPPNLIHLSLQKIKSQLGNPGRPVAEG